MSNQTQAQTGNQALVQELLAGGMYADHKGYYLARGFSEKPGLAELPFADFFENLSDPKGHKKMWLNPDGTFKVGRTSFECDGLMPLYGGIVDTQQKIVSMGFFMYSALVVSLHLNLAFYSRKLDCSPDVRSVYEKAEALGNTKVMSDIRARALACRVAAFIIYEGDGLGGYSDKVWHLWGRLYGVECPANPEILSSEEAKACKEAWNEASDEVRKDLFKRWWGKVHPETETVVVDKLYAAYKIVKRYQTMESPNCPPDQFFDSESNFDVQAALTGFFRRSAVGMGEAKAYDANSLEEQAHRFSDMLDGSIDKLKGLVKGNNGITPFGEYILNVLNLNLRRSELVDTIIERQKDDDETKKQNLAEGFRMRVSKRGRARL